MTSRQIRAFLLVGGFVLFFIVQLFHNSKVQKATWIWAEDWSEEVAESSKSEKKQETEKVDYFNLHLNQTSPCLVVCAIAYPKATATGGYYAPQFRWPAQAIWRLYSLFCNYRK